MPSPMPTPIDAIAAAHAQTENARAAQLDRLSGSTQSLGPRALEILADIAARLATGAQQYGGDFDDKPRDWDEEANEEALDMLVYITMSQIKRRERQRADAERAKAACRGGRVVGAPIRELDNVTAERQQRASVDYRAWAAKYGEPTERDAAWPTHVGATILPSAAKTGVDFVDNG